MDEIVEALPGLRKHAQRLTNNHDVDDLLHDTFIRCVVQKAKATGPLVPWMKAVMRNVHLCRWRRGGRNGRRYDNPFTSIETIPDFDITHDARIEHAVEAADLLDHIATLPPRRREIVELTALGYDSREISNQLGITASSVTSQLFYARKQLNAFN